MFVTLFANFCLFCVMLQPSIWSVTVQLFNMSDAIYYAFPPNTNNLHTTEWFQAINNNLKIEQVYLSPRWDRNRYNHSGSKWIWEQWLSRELSKLKTVASPSDAI